MFGAIRIEKRPLKYMEQARKLIHHTHQKRKPMSYYLKASPEEEDEKEAEERSLASTPATPGMLAQ